MESLVLGRSEAYIGVLVDDLVTKGVDEPYRMFTSRAEYRLLLRQDNADLRLLEYGKKFNLLEYEQIKRAERKAEFITAATKFLNNTSIEPSDINNYLSGIESAEIKQKQRIINLIVRPEISLKDLLNQINTPSEIFNAENFEFLDTLEIELKYKNYIEREREFAGKLDKFDSIKLPIDLDYFSLGNISYEAREKLSKIKPENLAQASRISGVSPADIAVILGQIKSK